MKLPPTPVLLPHSTNSAVWGR